MNFNQLNYFKTVCEAGSVSGAAEILHISQPSLSLAIKELESEFGVELFKRRYRGMTLTEEGEQLYRLTKGLLSHTDDVVRFMNELGGKGRVLRLGVPPMIGSITLPKICGDYVKSNPNVKLDLTEAGTSELVKLLCDDRLDMALIPHDKPLELKFESVKVAEYEIVCLSSSNSPLGNLSKVSPKDLKGIPLVTFKQGFFQTERIMEWFKNAGVTPEILIKTDQLSTLVNLIKSGVASGFAFRELVTENSNLTAVQTDCGMPVTVSLVWKSGARLLESMKNFLRYVKNLL